MTQVRRGGTPRLLAQAIESEVEELLDHHGPRRTENGQAGVDRNGHHLERSLQTGIGPLPDRIPKFRAQENPVTFRSSLVPSYPDP